jgi:hypothetical protein
MREVLIASAFFLLTSAFPATLVADGPTPTYLVAPYANNAGPGSVMDQILFLINVGAGGSPETSPVGDVCANIYVFDNTQEMIACCSCRLTPNELVTSSIPHQLTNNPLIPIIPIAGVIKIMPTAAGASVCNPTAPSASSDASQVRGFSSHLEISGSATFITETNIPSAPLGSEEAVFLPNACLFVKYLGSSYDRGTCSCTGQNVNSGTTTYSISGAIGGAGGSGATVNLTGTSTATVIADASGNFMFTGLGPGSYTVTPSKTGFTFWPASLLATITTVNSADVSGVNFTTVGYSISGAISGAGGVSATVNLTGPSTATATADAVGNYSFTGLQNGSYTVTPSKTGFSFNPTSQPAAVNSGNVAGVNFSTVSYSISGTISGAGGNGATVNLTGTSTATVMADASGNYTFAGLQNGSYTVTPSKTGFLFTPASQPATISSGNVTGVNFSTITYSISGTISGLSINGATVVLTGSSTAVATTDASGNYSFTGLQNGSYTVTPTATGFIFTPTSQSITINNSNLTGVNFLATVTYSISGTIKGLGGKYATVILAGSTIATVTADGSGNFTFPNVVNGTYLVAPSNPGFRFAPDDKSVTVNGANVAGVNFNSTGQ